MAGQIADLKGLGPVTQRHLAEIGIVTVEDVRALGAVEAYVALRFHFGRRITLNTLYGLDAVLRDLRWQDVTPERKFELRQMAEAGSKPE